MKVKSVEELLIRLGLWDSGRVSNGELSIRCPLHSDSSPSFSINLETGAWICYAQCGGGNAITLVNKLGKTGQYDVSGLFHEAPLRAVPIDYEVIDRAAFYAATTAPPAKYLDERKISAEAAAELGIRFNPWEPTNSVGNKVGPPGSDPAWYLPFVHPETHDMMGWQIKGSVSRAVRNLGKKSATLFGIELVVPGSDLIVVESPLDVAVLRTLGIRNTVSAFGTALASSQVSLVADLNPSRIIFFYDNDEAGRNATNRHRNAKALLHIPRYTFTYEPGTEGLDPGELAATQIRGGLENAQRCVLSVEMQRKRKGAV